MSSVEESVVDASSNRRVVRLRALESSELVEDVRDAIVHVHQVRDLPEVTSRGRLQALRDRFQVVIWQRLIWRLSSVTNEIQPHRAPSDNDYVRPIPAGRRYPALGNAPLIFSELTPPSERHRFAEIAVIRATLWLKEWYGLSECLPQVYTSIGAPYPKLFESLWPQPSLPEDFRGPDKLAGLARRGPFSLQTQRTGDDTFALDLRALEQIQPRKPFIACGGIARFGRDNRTAALKTLEIEFQGTTLRPGAPGWTLAERRMLAGLNTQTTVVEHLVRLHIATAGVWGIVARMAFSARHPLRMLFQPFTMETSRVNNYSIDGLLLTEHSNVPAYTGYTLEQASRLICKASQDFDVSSMDPERRARAQGVLDDPAFPTVNSAVAVFRIYRRLTSAWCQHYLKSEIDLETRAFCQQLDASVANGVLKLLEIERWEDLTVEHVAHLLAIGAFASSVGHHVVNDLTRDYFMAFHLMAPAINADGYPTLGVVLEKMLSVVSAGVQRYKLLSEPVLPDDTGRGLWARFQEELKQYEQSHASDPDKPYLIHPSRVSSSIHA